MTTSTYRNRDCNTRASQRPAIIRAELTGADTCEAEGVTVTAPAPVLALCRKLIEAGLDQDRRLDVYRAGVLALRVRSLGEGARLTVVDNRHGRPVFRPFREAGCGVVTASPGAPIGNSAPGWRRQRVSAPAIKRAEAERLVAEWEPRNEGA